MFFKFKNFKIKYNLNQRDIKTCVIGSRDQLCINPQVSQQKNYTTKLNMCKAKVNAKTCFFYNNVESNNIKLN